MPGALALAVMSSLVAAGGAPDDSLLRIAVAQTALAQTKTPDPAWHPDQRDCAGLVRFAYRTAYQKLRPQRLETPLFRDARGRALHFADAQTLVAGTFSLLGRDRGTRRTLRSGDLLAFRQPPAEDGTPRFHLMLVVRTRGARSGELLVVYHPGSPGASVRVGPLEALAKEAPLEWQPVPENHAFIGFMRFKEWLP